MPHSLGQLEVAKMLRTSKWGRLWQPMPDSVPVPEQSGWAVSSHKLLNVCLGCLITSGGLQGRVLCPLRCGDSIVTIIRCQVGGLPPATSGMYLWQPLFPCIIFIRPPQPGEQAPAAVACGLHALLLQMPRMIAFAREAAPQAASEEQQCLKIAFATL